MWVLVLIAFVILLFLFSRKRKITVRPDVSGRLHPRITRRQNSKWIMVNDSHVVRRSRLIRRENPPLPARYCSCGKLKAICNRDEADATHAAGMHGPRKKK